MGKHHKHMTADKPTTAKNADKVHALYRMGAGRIEYLLMLAEEGSLDDAQVFPCLNCATAAPKLKPL